MGDTKLTAIEELRWIEEAVPTRPPQIDEFEIQSLSATDRFFKKLTDNIFVPLGLIATTACLSMGLLNFKRGDTKKQQFYMRGRVLCQGFTLVAMTVGLWWSRKKREEQKQRKIEPILDRH